MPFCLGSRIFRTKKGAKLFIQKILQAPLEEKISDENKKILFELFKRHQRYKEKCQTQLIIDIERRQNRFDKKYNEFLLVRKDGSSTDISYNKCLSCSFSFSPKKTTSAHLDKIFREIVNPQIKRFRKQQQQQQFEFPFYTIKCTKCNKFYESENEIQVDHHSEKLPFRLLKKQFLLKENLLEKEIVTRETKNGIGREFVDQNLSERFKIYHEENAILRFLCKKCNGSAKRKAIDQIEMEKIQEKKKKL